MIPAEPHRVMARWETSGYSWFFLVGLPHSLRQNVSKHLNLLGSEGSDISLIGKYDSKLTEEGLTLFMNLSYFWILQSFVCQNSYLPSRVKVGSSIILRL